MLILRSNQNDMWGLIFKSVETCGKPLLLCTEETYVIVVLSDFRNKTGDKPKTLSARSGNSPIYKAFDHLAPVKTSLKSLSNFPLPGFSLSPQSQLLIEDMVNNVGHLKNAD